MSVVTYTSADVIVVIINGKRRSTVIYILLDSVTCDVLVKLAQLMHISLSYFFYNGVQK